MMSYMTITQVTNRNIGHRVVTYVTVTSCTEKNIKSSEIDNIIQHSNGILVL